MKKILFLSQAGRNDQSTQHRISPIAEELRNRGYYCDVIYGKRRSFFRRGLRYVSTKSILKLVSNINKYDIVVINRDGSPIAYLCALLCSRNEIKIVFDIDDAIYKQKTVGNTPIPIPGRLYLTNMIEMSNHITTGNTNIEEYVEKYNKDVTTVPTPANTKIFNPNVEPAREYDSLVIGWMGVSHGHEENLKILREPLINIGKEYDVTFRIISALGNNEIYEIFEELEKWMEVDYGYDERMPLKKVAQEVATFDIATLPINPEDKMMEGKSIIKILEHLALQIPVVASNSLVYGDLLTHKQTGMLSSDRQEWRQNIEYLIEKPDGRLRLSRNGYKMVKEKYTVTTYTNSLEEILNSL